MRRHIGTNFFTVQAKKLLHWLEGWVLWGGQMENDMQELAQQIIDGEVTHPYGIGGYYDRLDWPKAAQYALDSQDWSELTDMVAREELYEQWKEETGVTVDFHVWALGRGLV